MAAWGILETAKVKLEGGSACVWLWRNCLKSSQESDSQSVHYIKIYRDGAQNREKMQILMSVEVAIVKKLKSNKHASETKLPKKSYV